MAEIFEGIEAALEYRGEGAMEHPCLAVDLAITGVGTMEDCHDALVAAGISTEDGMSTLPEDGGELTINGHVLSFSSPLVWFDAGDAVLASTVDSGKGYGTIVATKLTDDPSDERMHLILLAGRFVDDGSHDDDKQRAADILVGDSLIEDTQRVPSGEVEARLQRTVDWAGALFSYVVAVDPISPF